MSLLTVVHGYGVLAARPAAGNAGRIYYATDTQAMYRDNGTSWDSLNFGNVTLQMVDITQTADNPSLTATTFTAYPNLSGSSITLASGSKLDVELFTNFAFVTGSAYLLFEITVGSTTQSLGACYNGTTATLPFTGATTFSGLAAGANSVTLKYKVTAQTAAIKPIAGYNLPGDTCFLLRLTEHL